MRTICELASVPKDVKTPDDAAQALSAAQPGTGVYQYWHAICYLLDKVEPGNTARALMEGGIALPSAEGLPSNRVLSIQETKELADLTARYEPEALLPHYAPAAMDEAGVYPQQWAELDEEHDILGNLLEHYHYLREYSGNLANKKAALVVLYRESDD